MLSRSISRGRRAVASTIAVALLAALVAPPYAYAGSSYISGSVKAADGVTALPGIGVRLWRLTGSWNVFQTTTSFSNGAYAFNLLDAGTYAVEFRDPAYAHVLEFYNGVPAQSSEPTGPPAGATTIVLTGFDWATNVNATLDPAGAISGVVRDSGGAPVAGIRVNAYRRLGDDSYATDVAMKTDSAADGTYALRGMGTGAYAVQFYSGTYAEHYHHEDDTAGVTTKSLASPVQVSTAATTTGIDAVMLMWGGVDGTVRSASGPLDNVQVDSFRAEGASWAPQPQLQTWSVADGTFASPTRAYPGRYRVRFSAPGYPAQYHRSSLTTTFGADVIVAESATTTVDTLIIASDTTAPVSAVTTLPAGWVSGDVTASISATDDPDGSGVAAMYWRLGDATPTLTAGPVTVSAEGDHEFRYWAVDGFGNVEATNTGTLRIDKTPPVTEDDAPEGWRSGDVTVTLTPSDSLSGPVYTLVGTSSVLTTYSAPVTVTAEGVTTLSYLSADLAGNRESTKTAEVRIDRTPPSTTASYATSYVGTTTVSFVASDALSGVGFTRWTLDGGAVQTGTVAQVRPAGPHTLDFASVDAVGNVEGTQTAEFVVIEPDYDPPVTTLAGVPASWTAGDVVFSLSATDAGGWGVSASYYKVGTGLVTTYSVPVTITAEGTTTLSYLSADLAGNREVTKTAEVRIDRTPPAVVPSMPASVLGTATVSLTASDALSGVARTWISVDGSETEASSLTFSILGTHTVGFWAQDNAGNSSTPVTGTVRVLPDLVIFEVAGIDRFATAVAASQRAFPAGAPTVVLATGRNWPDALGGSALAGASGGPVLLTEPNSLPAAVAAEISRLGATKVIVLGGSGAVGDGVLAQVDALPAVSVVQRVGGRDRYETANMVATLTAGLAGPDPARKGIVVTGLNYPDALAASPLSAARGWPVYLSGPGGLSAATLQAMADSGVSGALVLGGPAVVPSAVESELAGLYGDDAVTRLSGANRYGTAAQVAEYAVTEQGMSWDAAALVRGDDFADALSGGPLQGVENSVILLTHPSALAPEAEAVLGRNRDLIDRLRYLGGIGAVTQVVRDRVTEVLRPEL